jgi:ketosteroid isomerase-like protein
MLFLLAMTLPAWAQNLCQPCVLRLQASPLPDGQRYALRGSEAPLSWDRGLAFAANGQLDLHWAGAVLEAKLVVEDARGEVLRWERGNNRRCVAGAVPGAMAFDVRDEELALRREVEAADAALFKAVNAGDAAAMAPYFSPNLEFFHDLGGLSGKAQTVKQLAQNFGRKDLRLRRDLLPEGHAIYPLPGIGAMQIGRHAFCRQELQANGVFGPEQCAAFGFSTVWEKAGGQWRMLRVLSYGH